MGLVLHEDEHVLVINKPAGMNTHSPSPFAGEGIHEWLRNREPRWAKLAIVHRLDKETSGVMVFGKTPEANRSLTEQFATRRVRKTYRLLTDRKVGHKQFTIRTTILRDGERYLSGPGGEAAETRFRVVGAHERKVVLEAEPVTGRTHQIRVHAAESGFPIFGDVLYGGTPADRVCLHAERLEFGLLGKKLAFEAAADFGKSRASGLREAVIENTNAYRMIHGASDGHPGLYVDRLGEYLLCQSEYESGRGLPQSKTLPRDSKAPGSGGAFGVRQPSAAFEPRGVYHKNLELNARKAAPGETSPRLVGGEMAPQFFPIVENGIRYEASFSQGYSVGLFFDQRDNRRRILTNYIAPDFTLFEGPATVLNTFAYTCGFSVCAAKAGASTTSIDLSKKYLEWGKRNFALNGIDLTGHDFIYGDVFGWLRRLGKKERVFDFVILDPPTFSQSKEWGAFQAQMDYGKLVTAALPLLRRGGVMLASTNAAGWKPEEFLAVIESSVGRARRSIEQRYYAPQPPDFPITREEPAYLKTAWLRIA